MKFHFFNYFPDPDDTTTGDETDNSTDESTSSSDSSDTSDSSSTETSENGDDTTTQDDTTSQDDTNTDSSTDNQSTETSDEQSDNSSSDSNESGDNQSSSSDDSSTSDTSGATTDSTNTASTNSTTDSEGFKLLTGGTWNNSATLRLQGGQVMHFQIKNVNVLGTTITIDSNLGGKKSLIIGPTQTVDMRFDCFGSEPMGWTFDVSTNSDAFIVAWKLFSSWVPGDPPNG